MNDDRCVHLVSMILMMMLQADEYVPVPKGDVHKKKEVVQDVTLHDLDVANARPQVLIGCFAGRLYCYRLDARISCY